ncbi:MAG TPA: arginine deiminase-related protein [Acidimicrobiales bacterium]|nr:arginine deiminase-related protein [Acidimicrobiales bacterium]
MTALGWGRKYLMCRPDNFDVFYEINPWMHAEVKPDTEQAIAQFEGLVSALQAAGATLEFQPSVPGLPDLVFTANAGIVNGKQFVPASFRHPERQGETPHDEKWFEERDYALARLPEGLCHEGAGDALPFAAPEGKGSATGMVLVSGYRFRSDFASHAPLSALIGAPVRSVELVDERLYHLDLTFCPLDDRRAMIAPMGLDAYGLAVLQELVPEPLLLEDPEAEQFVANSVVVGTNIVMPSCPPRVGRILEGWGFDIAVAPVGEFLKAGGGCRCLTLALDVVLGEPGEAIESDMTDAEPVAG